ncbi:hypothetical protein HDU96_007804 [Phlyctochytrium bullatum]|nr:hypothetical protein HDU96_007804 [Phlyctochytrium bullatum]
MHIIPVVVALLGLVQVALSGGTPDLAAGSTDNNPSVTVLSAAEEAAMRTYTQFSLLAYCANYTNFRNFDCPICGPPGAGGFTGVRALISPDTKSQGFVAVDRVSRSVVIAFQGAMYLENWLSAANFPRTKFDVKGADEDAWVLQGFYNSYKAFRPTIFSALTAALRANPTYTLHALGHSYGSALAAFTVAEYLLTAPTRPRATQLTLLGSPRLGNYEFARLLDTTLNVTVTRLVHSADRVVRLPPIPLGYRHAGTEVWIDVARKRMVRCGGVAEGLDESGDCVNKVPFASLGNDPHVSYWDRLPDTTCRRTKEPVPVRYLPFEVLSSKT